MSSGDDTPPVPPDPEASPDVEQFTFTDRGPWVVDRDQLSWTPGIAVLRATTRRQVPLLTRRRVLPPPGRLGVVAVRLGAAVLGWAVVERRRGGSASRAGLSRRLRLAAEHLGPTYIKLGQIISSGEGIFPEELVGEFKKCRDQVPAEDRSSRSAPWSRTICGQPLEDGLRPLRPRAPGRGVDRPGPRGHRSRTGEDVVVKVQRPSVAHAGARATSRSWRGWRRSWSAASRSPRWPTRRRSSSCSPRRSSRSSTSASRPRTCSTSPTSFAELDQRGYVVPRPHPDARHPPGAGHGAPRRLRASTTSTGMQAPASTPHEVVRTGMIGFIEGVHDPRHLPRRPARRQPVRARPTGASRCSTSASPAA